MDLLEHNPLHKCYVAMHLATTPSVQLHQFCWDNLHLQLIRLTLALTDAQYYPSTIVLTCKLTVRQSIYNSADATVVPHRIKDQPLWAPEAPWLEIQAYEARHETQLELQLTVQPNPALPLL